MESGQKFKFTLEELKKINLMLPKGFKFVPKEQILKKQGPARGAPRKKITTPLVSESATPPLPKVKVQRQEQYQPQKKVVTRPPPQAILIMPDEQPAGTSLKLIQRLKRHPGYLHLIHFQKTNQTQITLKQIEDKAIKEGENYRIQDLEADLNTFFLMVYKYSVKTSNDYRLAAQLQNHLWQLLKIQRAGDAKRAQAISRANVAKKRVPPVKIYQPLASYKPASALQKRQLGMMIRKLSSQNLQQVIYIMFESTEVKEYTFDLDNIHIKKFRQLEQFVKKCMQKAVDWDPRMLEDEQFSNQSQFIIENDYSD